MLALVRRRVETLSGEGFGTVTFPKCMGISDLRGGAGPGICLVCFAENGHFVRGLSAEQACPRPAGLLDRNATQRCFRGFLDLLFALGIAAPVRKREALLDHLGEFLDVLRLKCVRIAERERAIEERFLNRYKLLRDRLRNSLLWDEALPVLARPV